MWGCEGPGAAKRVIPSANWQVSWLGCRCSFLKFLFPTWRPFPEASELEDTCECFVQLWKAWASIMCLLHGLRSWVSIDSIVLYRTVVTQRFIHRPWKIAQTHRGSGAMSLDVIILSWQILKGQDCNRSARGKIFNRKRLRER